MEQNKQIALYCYSCFWYLLHWHHHMWFCFACYWEMNGSFFFFKKHQETVGNEGIKNLDRLHTVNAVPSGPFHHNQKYNLI